MRWRRVVVNDMGCEGACLGGGGCGGWGGREGGGFGCLLIEKIDLYMV